MLAPLSHHLSKFCLASQQFFGVPHHRPMGEG